MSVRRALSADLALLLPAPLPACILQRPHPALLCLQVLPSLLPDDELLFSSVSLSLTSLSKAAVALVRPLTGSLNPGYFTALGTSVNIMVSGSWLIAVSVSL